MGKSFIQNLQQASETILSARRDAGIQTDSLMVLEISSDALSGEMLELLISRFQLFLVEETPVVGTDRSRLVVQFENQAAIDQFNAERATLGNRCTGRSNSNLCKSVGTCLAALMLSVA